MITKQELIDFETSIATAFNNAEIPYPIHLSKGNEDALIKIFKDFKNGDYFFSQWRNHYHALLAGIPPEEVRRQIMAGRSMTVCSPEHRFFSSAIVAGIIPIALGVAWQLKRMGSSNKVWVCIGDMTAQTGIAMECYNYAKEHDLPLVSVVEDNGKSVCTITKDVWPEYRGIKPDYYYQWDLSQHYPHSGAGRRIQF
jgi:pyruvate dehydrogenase E1 component alpha subunit